MHIFRITALIPILFFSVLGYSQDIIDVIAERACECFDNVDDFNKSEQELQIEIGICIVKEAQEFSQGLKKQYKIDFSKNPSKAGKQLGELVGIRMVNYCPNFIMAAAGKQDYESARKIYRSSKAEANPEQETNEISNDEEKIITPKKQTVKGKISSLNTGEFMSINFIAENGKNIKIYWFEYFQKSELILTDFENLKTKDIEISYVEQEVYQNSISDYMKIKVINSMNIIE